MQSELTLIEQVKLGKIWEFPGGINPPERKSLSNQTEIGNFTTHTLYIPIQQHIGVAGSLLVTKGESVLKGQALTSPGEGLSLPVHAPTSGVISDIIDHVDAHPSGKTVLTIVLEADGKDLWVNKNPLLNWQELDRDTVVKHIQAAGVSGLGGASFPTYVKLSPHKNIDLLILNGVECEPYITADDVLMRYHANEIVQGAQIIQHLVAAKLCVIAIEDNKTEAIASIEKALADVADIELRVVPTKYPSGGEKQLVELITGLQVPSGGIPADIGIVMQNVGTSFAVKRATIDGEALVSRVVTVTGERVKNPQNLWVPLGTPIKTLLQNVGYSPEKTPRLIMGGPMMGFNIVDDMMPVVKSTNCILAPSNFHLPERGVEQNCIRCGQCADACPAELLPQQLQWFAKADEHEKLKEYDLFDCIECGACAYVCPSQIPLVQYYRIAKSDIRQAEEEKLKAEKAKRRFEVRQERLERDKQARLLRHKESAEKRKKALAQDGSAKDKIAAALARAKAKKATSENTDDLAASDTPQDKVAAAIARAKAKKLKSSKVSVDNSADSTPEASLETSLKATDTAPTTNPNKDRVAAAVARAKAKKLAKEEQEKVKNDAELKNETDHKGHADAADKPVSEAQVDKTLTAAEERKAKVAAAVAKAKAKKQKAAADEPNQEPTLDFVDKASAKISNEDKKRSADDERKAKVAAAVAKAKAKAKKQATESENSTNTSDKETPDLNVADDLSQTPEQIRKDKVAAAIAKAKAKKNANNDTDNGSNNS
ncbi:electron transport complex subunit RsxC [Psychrosphaera sp. B3R10]|uniref:electron transport complex subunit RsxC n=1 Tax=unclassified Psychrosphaera TaxID=2641570 RepID=UPI001C0A0E1B|nr:electron transport complex subunit RsxC [Psychrosphaera sp. I2R16]MBU2991125.1 electron transport complex subunit RsxC [Psychrosphaera sp. B3R10]